jgi:WD40 repeat protein
MTMTAVLRACLLAVLFIFAGCASQDRGLAVEDGPDRGRAAEAPEIEVFPQLGHSLGLTSHAFSLDGTRIVSGSYDETLKLWDAATGREIRTLTGHSSGVSSVAFSPDGNLIVSGDVKGILKVWNTATGEEIHTLTGHSDIVVSVVFSPDSKLIISGSDTIKVWDAATGREIHTLQGHSDYIYYLAFSPDGTRIISCARDDLEDVKIWDTATGREIRILQGNSDTVISVAFSPDGKQIVSSSIRDNAVKVWDAATGRENRILQGHSDTVVSVAFSPDSKRIVSGDVDGVLKIWDAVTGRELLTLQGHSNGAVIFAAFSSNGEWIVSGSNNNTVKIWDIATGKEIRSLKAKIPRPIFGNSVTFSPNNVRIVFESNDGVLRIWDAATNRELCSLQGYSSPVSSVTFSPDGELIVSGSFAPDNTIKVWDAATGREIHTLQGHSGSVSSVVFSPDGKWIVSSSDDSTIKVWDAATGKEMRTMQGHSGGVMSVAFSPNGAWIVSSSFDSTIKVWEAATGRETRTMQGHSDGVMSVAFSPDGAWIVSGSTDGTVRVWDAARGRELRTLRGPSGEPTVAFSPDGAQIVSAGSDTIKVWEAATGTELRSLQGNTGPWRGCTFSPDGTRIVSIFWENNTIRVWDAATGREIFSLRGHSSHVWSVALSPDGKRIVSGSEDRTTRLWDAATGKEIAQFISFGGNDTQIAAATRGLTVETEAQVSSVEGEWLSITPDGYYTASPRGDRYLNTRVTTLGDNPVTTVSGIDAYRSVFYNPDVVHARLAGLPDPASKADVTIQQAASFLPPTVTLGTAPRGNTAATANLAVAVSDQNQPIKNIKVFINGRLVGRDELAAMGSVPNVQIEKASITVTGGAKTVNFNVPLALDPGLNRVEVTAFNGYSETRRALDIVWDAPVGQKPALPNLWILAVGVNAYTDSRIRSLNYCANDARELIASFKAQEGTRYAKVQSLLIADGEALAPTGENIRNNLQFLTQAGPRDVVLLFLAGHGITGQAGAFYFLPSDAALNADGKTVDTSRAVAGTEIMSVLDMPGNRLVFIDACQSGGVDSDRMVRALMDTNAFVFTSSKGNELSQERAEFRHGVFTYSIIQGLKKRRENLGVLQLSGEVQIDVPRITDNQQHPTAYSLGFQDFIIAETR